MPKGRMTAADRALLAELLARNPTAIVEREASALQAKRGRGRPDEGPWHVWRRNILRWSAVEMMRGEDRAMSVAKAARLVTAQGYGVSASEIEKSHRAVTRLVRGGGWGKDIEEVAALLKRKQQK
jgi:hypothetical protein